MNVGDWVTVIAGIAGIYLMWQQNQIFKKQNEIFAAQAQDKTAMPTETARRSGLMRYWPTIAMIALMLLISYDIYDRHHFLETGAAQPFDPSVPLSEQQKKIFDHLTAVEANWSTYPYEEVMGRHFENTQVLLDGRKFYNCTFLNVTFVYQGTAPFEFDGNSAQLSGLTRLSSNLPLAHMVFNMFIDLGAVPGGATNEPVPIPKR